MYTYILAMAIFVSADDPPTDSEVVSVPGLRQAIVSLAIDLDIVDERERAQFVFWAEAKKRYQNLRDAPALCDHQRFSIDVGHISDLQRENYNYKDWLQHRYCLHSYDIHYYKALIEEVDTLSSAWDKLRESKVGYYYIHVRRQALKDLRDIIGEDNYYNGVMPPHVPLWRFENVKINLDR